MGLKVSEKILKVFSIYKSMETLDPRVRGSLDDWQHLCSGPLAIATYQIYKLWASWFQRGRFLSFSLLELYVAMVT